MKISKKPKAIVFIDGANMFYTQKKLGWFSDWKKIKKWIEKKFIASWNFYSGEKAGDSDFAFLVNFLRKELKRKVYIFSSKNILSWELKLLADKVIYLEDLKEEIFLKNWDLTRKEKSGIRKSLNRRS